METPSSIADDRAACHGPSLSARSDAGYPGTAVEPAGTIGLADASSCARFEAAARLVDVLTRSYTPYHADDALARFRDLLMIGLAGGGSGAFSVWDLPGAVNRDVYPRWVQRFLAELTWYSYSETTTPPPGQPLPHRVRIVARHFPARDELIALCRKHVGELFGGVASMNGRQTWCEKTPLNAVSTPFLLELFPDATMVHIARHPVQVVASFLDQAWAPGTVEDVCSWLEPLYLRWFAVREQLDGDSRLLDLRLEDLADDWPAQRAAMFDRLGLPDFRTPSEINLDRVAHWRALSPADERVVRRRLGFAIDQLGY